MKTRQLSALTSSVCNTDVVWRCREAESSLLPEQQSVDNQTRVGTHNWSVHNEYCFLPEYYAV